jgi:NAD(P)-dependent dehydrogenase (short-subunit alcohol dehydrogenase family)
MATTSGALAGRAALITGGASGIGLACAEQLVRDGAAVTIAARNEERLRESAARLEGLAPPGATVQWVRCDVADEDQVRHAVAVAEEPAGGLHFAVASAGTGAVAPVVVMTREQWQGVLDVNLTGAFLTLKHTAAAMARAGGGSFVAISSIASPLTHPWWAAYCVSKAGLDMLVRTAADELGVAGVRVNSVRPSLVPTDLATPLASDEEVVADYLSQIPLGRLGTVEDVANCVRFLLGPESSWITGQCIGIDGGHTLRRGPHTPHWVRAVYGDDAIAGTVRP